MKKKNIFSKVYMKSYFKKKKKLMLAVLAVSSFCISFKLSL
jgi:hypothetical protein